MLVLSPSPHIPNGAYHRNYNAVITKGYNKNVIFVAYEIKDNIIKGYTWNAMGGINDICEYKDNVLPYNQSKTN